MGEHVHHRRREAHLDRWPLCARLLQPARRRRRQDVPRHLVRQHPGTDDRRVGRQPPGPGAHVPGRPAALRRRPTPHPRRQQRHRMVLPAAHQEHNRARRRRSASGQRQLRPQLRRQRLRSERGVAELRLPDGHAAAGHEARGGQQGRHHQEHHVVEEPQRPVAGRLHVQAGQRRAAAVLPRPGGHEEGLHQRAVERRHTHRRAVPQVQGLHFQGGAQPRRDVLQLRHPRPVAVLPVARRRQQGRARAAEAVLLEQRRLEQLLVLPDRPVRLLRQVRAVRVLQHGPEPAVQLPAGLRAAVAGAVEPQQGLGGRVCQERQPDLRRRRRRLLGRQPDEAAAGHGRGGVHGHESGPVQAGLPQQLQLRGVRRREYERRSWRWLRPLDCRSAGHEAVPDCRAGCVHTAPTVRDRRTQGHSRRQPRKSKLIIIIVATVAGVLFLLAAVACCCFWMKRKERRTGQSDMSSLPPSTVDHGLPYRVSRSHPTLSPPPVRDEQVGDLYENASYSGKDVDLPLFDLDVILDATDNFAEHNKIGAGGFGPVYVGNLEDGQQVAFKRLSRGSMQGIKEFMNEVKLIAKLQHRNLVRLLGCCIDDDERILVYEYMHNQSLDVFIFDEGKSRFLKWQKRYDIILGVARGLQYLHEDSRFRIIHRDLKASNVLLDRNMVPKISDFGIARMFGGDQTTAYTAKVIGTYGYMAPEYAMDGIISIKSDVFSFGVLVLEIVTGKRNRGSYEPELDVNLLGYAWMLWKEGRSIELLDDEAMGSSGFHHSKVMRCIQVALLCVEAQPRNRPLMSSVVMMLGSENTVLPAPIEPGVNVGMSMSDTGSSRTRSATNTNTLTVTTLDAR